MNAKRKRNPKSELPLTVDQVTTIARVYSLSGRLLHGLFEKFGLLEDDERVALPNIRHAKFVASVVRDWGQETLAAVDLLVHLQVSATVSTGSAWATKPGAEIELEFPKGFSKVLVETVLKMYTVNGRENRTGHLDDFAYADVMRNIVTAEGCDEHRPK